MWLEFASRIEHWEADKLNIFLARPPCAGPHCDTPLVSAERHQRLSLFTKIIGAPWKKFIFSVEFYHCIPYKNLLLSHILQGLLLQQMCFHHIAHRFVTAAYTFVEFAQAFQAVFFCLLAAWPLRADFFSPFHALSIPFPISRNTSLVWRSSTNLSLTNVIRSFQIVSDKVRGLGLSAQAAAFSF